MIILIFVATVCDNFERTYSQKKHFDLVTTNSLKTGSYHTTWLALTSGAVKSDQ